MHFVGVGCKFPTAFCASEATEAENIAVEILQVKVLQTSSLIAAHKKVAVVKTKMGIANIPSHSLIVLSASSKRASPKVLSKQHKTLDVLQGLAQPQGPAPAPQSVTFAIAQRHLRSQQKQPQMDSGSEKLPSEPDAIYAAPDFQELL
eukprot:2968579-Amphidinium_carterae.1